MPTEVKNNITAQIVYRIFHLIPPQTLATTIKYNGGGIKVGVVKGHLCNDRAINEENWCQSI